jgi:hypothetical protein
MLLKAYFFEDDIMRPKMEDFLDPSTLAAP